MLELDNENYFDQNLFFGNNLFGIIFEMNGSGHANELKDRPSLKTKDTVKKPDYREAGLNFSKGINSNKRSWLLKQ